MQNTSLELIILEEIEKVLKELEQPTVPGGAVDPIEMKNELVRKLDRFLTPSEKLWNQLEQELDADQDLTEFIFQSGLSEPWIFVRDFFVQLRGMVSKVRDATPAE